jgi:uncharacterized cupin superfamily protein
MLESYSGKICLVGDTGYWSLTAGRFVWLGILDAGVLQREDLSGWGYWMLESYSGKICLVGDTGYWSLTAGRFAWLVDTGYWSLTAGRFAWLVDTGCWILKKGNSHKPGKLPASSIQYPEL